MGSAWSDVETKIAGTIGGLGVALGFAGGVANVHRYLPEHEHSSLLESYFFADVAGGKRDIRSWAVTCTQNLDPETRDTTSLKIDCEVTAFYAKGYRGAGRLLIMAHMSQVHQAIRALKGNLDGTCTRITDWTKVAIAEASVQSDRIEGEILIGRFIIGCEAANHTP